MIISRTPFRVSFVGGGTDLPDYYRKAPGGVVSCAIDKYMYICVSKNFHKKWKISYSFMEYADSIDTIQHEIVRAILKRFPFDDPLDIVSISDIPSGSGLGSSSAYTVGLLNALMAYSGYQLPPKRLAQIACEIEIDVLGKPIGKQDQYACSCGGLNYITFEKDDTVGVERIEYPWEIRLSQNLLLMFTGDTRNADSILSTVKDNINNNNICLAQKSNLARLLTNELNSNCPPETVAQLINIDWNLKRQLADSITNDHIEALRDKVLANGAIGCKLLGAGGDGFLLVYCDQEKQPDLVAALPGMILVPFMIDNDGSRILYRG